MIPLIPRTSPSRTDFESPLDVTLDPNLWNSLELSLWQREVAEAVFTKEQEKRGPRKIVTELEPATSFFRAEEEHQQVCQCHQDVNLRPREAYIAIKFDYVQLEDAAPRLMQLFSLRTGPTLRRLWGEIFALVLVFGPCLWSRLWTSIEQIQLFSGFLVLAHRACGARGFGIHVARTGWFPFL